MPIQKKACVLPSRMKCADSAAGRIRKKTSGKLRQILSKRGSGHGTA